MNIVIDTNIFISALIKGGATRDLIVNSKDRLLFPEFEFYEIEKHKYEIITKSNLSEREFNILLLKLLNYVKIIPSDIIIYWKGRAEKIIMEIDPDDVLFIATALAFKCPIWTDDKHFLEQKEIPIFTTKEMIKRHNE